MSVSAKLGERMFSSGACRYLQILVLTVWATFVVFFQVSIEGKPPIKKKKERDSRVRIVSDYLPTLKKCRFTWWRKRVGTNLRERRTSEDRRCWSEDWCRGGRKRRHCRVTQNVVFAYSPNSSCGGQHLSNNSSLAPLTYIKHAKLPTRLMLIRVPAK